MTDAQAKERTMKEFDQVFIITGRSNIMEQTGFVALPCVQEIPFSELDSINRNDDLVGGLVVYKVPNEKWLAQYRQEMKHLDKVGKELSLRLVREGKRLRELLRRLKKVKS